MRIVPYQPRYRDAFRDLNLEWITTHFEIEEEDRRVLGDPERYVLAPGGAILFALGDDGEPVGTGALLHVRAGVYELAKMAVAPRARGRGVGRALGEALVQLARDRGAARIELLSHRSLAPALALYRSLGFREVPMVATAYRRADVRMELVL
jgi:GNAT superfamily N-acetyltransferase